MRDHFLRFAGYNRWANRRLYAAAAMLSDAQWREDRGAFFGSMRGTLNHVLVGDRVWMHRFSGGTGPMPSALDEILFDDLPSLRAAREEMDGRIEAFVAGLSPEVSEVCAYRSMAGVPDERPLAQLLTHFFNHQTHHRGQAHGLLSGFGMDPPSLDMIVYMRERP